MRAGETVGILMDTNMTPPQGVFVRFFGIMACTASGLARVALKTGAAVVPGFLLVGSQRSSDMFSISVPNWSSPGAAITKPTSWRRRSSATMCSRRGYAVILTSGCGSTGAGRRGRQASRGSTERDGGTHEPGELVERLGGKLVQGAPDSTITRREFDRAGLGPANLSSPRTPRRPLTHSAAMLARSCFGPVW